MIFIYELDLNQHSTFVMTQDWSQRNTTRIVGTGDIESDGTIGALSEDGVRLYTA